jgi:hypothetical protein
MRSAGEIAPPESESQAEKPAQAARQTKQDAVPPDIQHEVSKRFEAREKERAIEEEMRRQDDDYRYEQERKEEERARRQRLRFTSQQQRDEDFAAKQERRDETAAQREDKRRERDRARQEKQQARDEAFDARQSAREQAELQKQVKLVPEAVPLHDEEAYRRRIREGMAERERRKRFEEMRREEDPKYAGEADQRDRNKMATTMAQAGGFFGVKQPAERREEPAAERERGEPQERRRAAKVDSFDAAEEADRAERRRAPAREDEDERRKRGKIDAFDAVEKVDRAERERTPASAAPQRRQEQRDERVAAGQPANRSNTASTNVAAGQPPRAPSVVAAPPSNPPPPTRTSNPTGAQPPAAGGGGAMGAMTAAMPVLGAGLAVAEMIKDQIRESGEANRRMVRGAVEFSKSVVSMQVESRMESVAGVFESVTDSVSKLSPAAELVAPATKELVRGLMEMDRVVKGAAQRLSQYDGRLAQQNAQQEVAVMIRDINRAQRFSERLAAANEQRFRAEQRLEDLFDRFMPLLLTSLENWFRGVEMILAGIDNTVKLHLQAMDKALDLLMTVSPLVAGVEALTGRVSAIQRLIREAREENNVATPDQMFDQFLSLQRPAAMVNVQPQAPAPGGVFNFPQ